jgi:homoserine kinase type II
MAIKTDISSEDMKIIFTSYDLGSPIKISPLSRGDVNTNYKVQTENGRYVFRLYEDRSLLHVRFEEEVLAFLENLSAISTAYIIPQKTGETIGNYKNKPFGVFQFLEGEHLTQEDVNEYNIYVTEIVRAIATLNKATENATFSNKQFVESCAPEDCWNTAQKNAERLDSDAIRKDRLDWTKAELNKIQLPNTLPKCICHRDPNLNNFLFLGKSLRGLIDFDMASYSCAVCDIGSLVYWLAWENRDSLDFGLTRKIIEDYETIRPLSLLEKKHIIDGLKMVIMMGAGWYIAEPEGFLDRAKVQFLNRLGRDSFNQAIENAYKPYSA